MDWLSNLISLIISIGIILHFQLEIHKLKIKNEDKDKQIQHLWTKAEQLQKKIEKLEKDVHKEENK